MAKVDLETIRDSIQRIADTPDGEKLFEWLAQERMTAFVGMTQGEGPSLHRFQGGYTLLSRLFNTHDVTAKKPKR